MRKIRVVFTINLRQKISMSKSINQHMSLCDIVTLIVLSVLWGGSFFFVEVLIDHLPPFSLVTMRVGLAALGLWLIVLALRLPIPKSIVEWRALLIVGILNNALPFSLIVWGQTQISSGLASIFNAMTPFFTVLVAGAYLTDERITPQKLFGILLGFVGVIILIGPDALNGVTGSVYGQFAVIGAAISYAFAAVYSRRFMEWGISPVVITTGQATTATLILIPIALITDGPLHQVTLPITAISALLGLAFFSTVIAYLLYFRLIQSAGATNAALVALLNPISAIVLGVTLLGETFSPLQAVGMITVLIGLLAMDGRVFRKVR